LTSEARQRPEINRWIIATTVMFSSLMVFLDTAVVNVSLPYIAGSLSATVDEATWALTAYLAATAVILPISGWLASTFGRRRLMLVSVASFTAASFLCGIAPSIELLVFFRILQGVTGGMMGPLSQAILLETFPPEERGKAMAFWAMGIIAAPVLGPLLGGYLTMEASWRWVFYVNVPIGVLALVMIELFIFDPPYLRRASRRVDYAGIWLLVVGIGALQVVLDRGQEDDWFASGLITTMVAVTVASLVVFIVRELSIEHPVVDLRVFREITFSIGTFISSMLFFILFGSMVLLPIFLQTVLGYSPLDAGMAMAPRGLGSLVATPIVGMLLNHVGVRKLLLSGLAIGAGTSWWLSLISLDVGYWDLFWPQFVQGWALGLLFVPLTVVTMSRISNVDMGNATSVYNVLRNVGSSVGIATVSTFLVRSQYRSFERLRAHFDGFGQRSLVTLGQAREMFLDAGVPEPAAGERALRAVAASIDQQAHLLSFTGAFELLAWLFVSMMPLVYLMQAHRSRSGGTSY
jgi:DHA2 family multidrug resistance protein